MAMKNFMNQLKGLKLRDIPDKVKPVISPSYLKQRVIRGIDNYNDKYIQTGSAMPIYHVCFGGMVFSYFVALPEERRHLEHQEHAKQHGEAAH